MNLRWMPGVIVVAVLGVAACSSTTGTGTVCTALFAQATVAVVDSAGHQVADATITTTLVRTGEVLPVTSATPLLPGVYVILDDGSVHKLRAAGDSVRVQAAHTGGSTTATYFFDVPDGCHINKVSGPSTLVLP